MAITPIINSPTDKPGYSTNLVNQTIGGFTDSSTSSILVNGSSGEVIYTSGSTEWVFTTILSDGENIFNVAAVDAFGSVSSPDTITVTLTTEDNLNLLMASPTGLTLERSKDSIIIAVIENSETEVIGYNFYSSEDPGGGNTGFTLLNRALVKESSFFKEETLVLSKTVETSGSIKTTFIVEEVTRNNFYSYTHNRINQPLGTKPITEPNHYVVTAVGFDNVLLQQVESPFSAELGTTPLILDTSIRDLPLRTTTDVQQSYIDQVLTTDSEIDVKPGTVTRDIHINPPSDEFERIYIILDFLHRSQSFLTLLEFDDADGDGISDPVLESDQKIKLKEALLISDENADRVQQIIDDSFTKLSGNVNIKRKGAEKSVGQVLFFTRSTPLRDAAINAGGIVETLSDENNIASQFQVLTDFTLTINNLDNFFNPLTQRYEVTLDVQAIEAGDEKNIDGGKIKVVVSGIDSIFGVTNNNPTEFGQDLESNSKLAQRAILSFVSVDAGTEGGYLATTLGTPNVSRSKIISAGETLMMRDIDPLRLVHTFGMVDIYIQGSKQTTLTDEFGFIFNTTKKEQALIQSVSLFHFRSQNESITIDKPIFDVLDVKNVTKSASYDLEGFTIIGNGQVINLDETLPANMFIGLDPSDIITISYRNRDSTPYIFQNQPVESIVSVVGEISGPLTGDNYDLLKIEDPLQFGNSTSAKDKMQLLFVNGVPTGEVIDIKDENILLFAENESNLSRFGIDGDTLVVTDDSNTTTYLKDIDYIIDLGDQNTLTTIKRTPTSSIPSGDTVFVDYTAGENITVRYNVNTLLLDVQTRIETMRHLTADVVVKGALQTFIDIDMKVVLFKGSEQTSIDRQIRTAIVKLFSDKQIGESIYQSDVINVVENVIGISHLVVPFTKMVKSNYSYVMREPYTGSWDEFQTVNTTSFKSVGTLSWKTSAGGGSSSLFAGVFENDVPLVMAESASEVAGLLGRSYIDEDGHLFVSTKLGPINDAKITTTYIVQNATGSRDIEFSDIEYGSVGTITITFDFIPKFRGF